MLCLLLPRLKKKQRSANVRIVNQLPLILLAPTGKKPAVKVTGKADLDEFEDLNNDDDDEDTPSRLFVFICY